VKKPSFMAFLLPAETVATLATSGPRQETICFDAVNQES
jgi:hypothetical protein